MNLNLPYSFPDVPGIDDCDDLFTCSSRDGEESLYARIQDFTFEGKTYYACALTWDGKNNCHDIPFPEYGFNKNQIAHWLVETAREQWGKGNFVKCLDTRKYTR
jgi:hypothetical protein